MRLGPGDPKEELSPAERAALERDDPAEILAVFGYSLGRCPDGRRCEHDAAWAHPCDRDENGQYECERAACADPYEDADAETRRLWEDGVSTLMARSKS